MRSGSPKHLAYSRKRQLEGGEVLLPEDADVRQLTFRTMFGRGGPVEIEIGTGKGTFLLARAAARPEANFLGIEWARAYCLYAADRVRRAKLTNVRMLRADASAFFRFRLPPASLTRVHVYFPDPWPKRRHHLRRLIQPTFVKNVYRALKPGGQLLVVTDHLDYFEHIRRVLLSTSGWMSIDFPVMADKDGEVVGTNFERKYVTQGRNFYRIARMKYGEHVV